MDTFDVRVPGKVILVGEHAVIRGKPAIVAPLKTRVLELRFEPGESFDLVIPYEKQNAFRVVEQVIDAGLLALNKTREDLCGRILVQSTIPVAAGLGSSAALCVAVGRLMQNRGWLKEHELFAFSRSLENLFHGESSGVDIAVVLAGRPLKFLKNADCVALDFRWQPHFAVSFCGQRGSTVECVQKVKSLFDSDPKRAQMLDDEMGASVEQAIEALKASEKTGLSHLSQSVSRARECFQQWGLISPELERHMSALQSAGALAVKPTGSGAGGHVLSLWSERPLGLEIDINFFQLNPS